MLIKNNNNSTTVAYTIFFDGKIVRQQTQTHTPLCDQQHLSNERAVKCFIKYKMTMFMVKQRFQLKI